MTCHICESVNGPFFKLCDCGKLCYDCFIERYILNKQSLSVKCFKGHIFTKEIKKYIFIYKLDYNSTEYF